MTPYRPGDRVRVSFPQCERQPGTVREVLASGLTLAIEWDNHASNVPFFWAMSSACELVDKEASE